MEIRPRLDPEHRAVLADWLALRGDPRGELLSLELALERAALDPGLDPAPLQGRLDVLRADLEPRWEAELAATLELSRAQLHAFMPGRWYAGLLLELALCPAAELARGEVPAVLFEWILASDAAVALEVIDAGELPGQVVLEQLATGPVRSRIHRLVLGDHRQVVGELALLGGQLPALRALEVRGPGIELMGFVHPQLEQLRLVCRGDWSGVLTTAGVQLPALSRLELRFDQRHLDAYWGPPGQGPPPEAIAGLLDRDALPALRTLSLSRLICDAHLLDALIAAPAFASLRCLALTDVGCLVNVFAELAQRAEALRHLERLELTDSAGRHTWVSDELRQLLPNLFVRAG
ncbi:MAG: hypothetical protein KC431_27415 [Myxococcales bacterium]|nr:hypothetical protein [Myxococcales bacterium]